MRQASDRPPYEYAMAGRALARERQSGDAALVLPTGAGALVAVVDGLGHGDEAALAAGAAISTASTLPTPVHVRLSCAASSVASARAAPRVGCKA